MMNFRNLATPLIAALALALPAGAALAEGDEPEYAPFAFTAAQAAGGGANYQRICAECHGAELEGLSAPSLVGDTFSWLYQPVSEFHAYVQELMPPGAGGTLSDAQVATIIAYIGQRNGMEAGPDAMPIDPAELEFVEFAQ